MTGTPHPVRATRCLWAPLLPDTAAVRAIHGLRRRWLSDITEHGIHRPSGAWFEITDHAQACAQMIDTLALTTEFGLGRRVLNQLDPDRDWWADLTDQDVPALAAFDLDRTYADRRYRLTPADRLCAPYAKTERAGTGIAADRLVAVATATVHELAAATSAPEPRCPHHLRTARQDHGPTVELIDRQVPSVIGWSTLRAVGAFLGMRLRTALADTTKEVTSR